MSLQCHHSIILFEYQTNFLLKIKYLLIIFQKPILLSSSYLLSLSFIYLRLTTEHLDLPTYFLFLGLPVIDTIPTLHHNPLEPMTFSYTVFQFIFSFLRKIRTNLPINHFNQVNITRQSFIRKQYFSLFVLYLLFKLNILCENRCKMISQIVILFLQMVIFIHLTHHLRLVVFQLLLEELNSLLRLLYHSAMLLRIKFLLVLRLIVRLALFILCTLLLLFSLSKNRLRKSRNLQF